MIATSYDEKIDITRDGGATGSDGVWVANWAEHLADVPCKIQWSSGQDVVVRDRITSRRDAAIFCAILDITVKDRIEYDSEVYDIVSVNKPANRFMKLAIKRNTEEGLAVPNFWVLNLDGTYYAEAINSGVHDITTQDLGIAAWVKISSSASLNSRVLFKGGAADRRYDFVIITAGTGPIRLTIADPDVDEYKITGATDLRDDTWHHLAAIIDRDNAANCKIYVDAVEDSTVKTGTLADIGSMTNSDKLTIGAANATGSGDKTTILEGEMHDLILAYPADIMAAGEMGAAGGISALYNNPGDPSQWPNFEDYWLCDEGSGVKVAGANQNLTLSNAAAWKLTNHS